MIGEILGVGLQAFHKFMGGTEENELLAQVMQCLKSIFVVHGPVGELLIALRKFIEYLCQNNTDNYDLLFKIIEYYTFEQSLFNAIFNIPYDKKTRI